MKNVVVEAVFFVPEVNFLLADVGHGIGNTQKVVVEFTTDILVRRIGKTEFESHFDHGEGVGCHPTGGVSLSELAVSERCITIDDANVVESEETALVEVVPFEVFAIDPPGEVEKEFVEHAFEEGDVTVAGVVLFVHVDVPGGPRGNGRIG